MRLSSQTHLLNGCQHRKRQWRLRPQHPRPGSTGPRHFMQPRKRMCLQRRTALRCVTVCRHSCMRADAVVGASVAWWSDSCVSRVAAGTAVITSRAAAGAACRTITVWPFDGGTVHLDSYLTGHLNWYVEPSVAYMPCCRATKLPHLVLSTAVHGAFFVPVRGSVIGDFYV